MVNRVSGAGERRRADRRPRACALGPQ